MWRPGLALRNIGAVDAVPPSLTERAPASWRISSRSPNAAPGWGSGETWTSATSRCARTQRRPPPSPPGRSLPAPPTALGRALLAFSSPTPGGTGHRQRLRSYTEHTITSPPRFRHALAVTRLTRVAVSRREFEADIYGVAMPVFGPGGHVIAAIEIAAADLDDDLQRIMPPLLIATRSLSRELAGGVASRSSRSTATTRTGAVEDAVSIAEISTFARFGGDHATRTLRKGAHAVPRMEEPDHDNDYRSRSDAECG